MVGPLIIRSMNEDSYLREPRDPLSTIITASGFESHGTILFQPRQPILNFHSVWARTPLAIVVNMPTYCVVPNCKTTSKSDLALHR